jgi:hypothetical protein
MNLMRFSYLIGAAVAAAALAGCAGGGSRGGRNDEPIRALLSADVMMLVSFDTDFDLTVAGPEIDAGVAREFERADTGRDGAVQPIEFQAWATNVLGGGQLGPYRLDFDRNVDNVITREEFETEIRARVGVYDQDQSGSLTRSEFVRLVGQARPPTPQRTMPEPGSMTRR